MSLNNLADIVNVVWMVGIVIYVIIKIKKGDFKW